MAGRRGKTVGFAVSVLVATAACCLTVCANESYLTPEAGGIAYRMQGEYSGSKMPAGQAEQKPVGVQVIALGEGRFRAVFYPGGLPGQGWCGKEDRAQVDGAMVEEADGFRIKFEGHGYKATTDGTRLTGTTDDGAVIRTRKVHRRSPTLGVGPPRGGRVLFDGTDTDAWRGGKMDEDTRLQVGTRTKDEFRSIRLHIEFMTPFEPENRGQGRGNSGVFIPGGWEVQVLDSFGLEGRHNECGGLYGTRDPRVNMCLPPLSWQTYDIEYRVGRQQDDEVEEMSTLTVWHNGVAVHHEVELEPIRPGRGKTVQGPVSVQNHGNPVVYRNIWVVELDG